jgi:L-asparaginase
MADSRSKGVLVIYTGGTIGSKPSQPDDPESPQVVVPWDEYERATPELRTVKSRFPVDPYEGIPPLDSCNVGPGEWRDMAQVIAEQYEDYNGFVILHGTDTMVYTANALSFMLGNLGKPVVLTGAQRSAMVSVRNDGTQNLLTALEFANPQATGLPVIPEVCIYFGGKLLRGNRTVKRDTSGYDAYESPNLEPLGIAGDKITVNERIIRRIDPNARFTLHRRLRENVLPIFIAPGIQETEMIKRQLETPGLRAVVVQAFGSGNIPTKPEFVKLFKDAHDRGIVVTAVSQCRTGPVELGIYETSAALLEVGFVAADDITLEAAQVKLMRLLGDEDIEPEEVEDRFQRSMAGEQSTSLWLARYKDSSGHAAHDGKNPGRRRIRGEAVQVPEERDRIERALLRLRQAKLAGPSLADDGESEPVDIELYTDLSEDDELDRNSSGFLGVFRKWPRSEAEIAIAGSSGVLMFDVTDFVKGRVKAGDRVSLTVAVQTPGASLSWEGAEVAVYVRD